MVSDQEIASCVESVLRSSGGAAGEASLAAVLSQAEAKLGVDLSHKATFIRDQMDLFFGPRLQPPLAKTQAGAAPPLVAAPAPAPAPAPAMPQAQLQQMQQQQQQQQLAVLQPQLIFQAMPQLPAGVPGGAAGAVSPQPPVPAMAFYPPPPLAFRVTSGLAGVATGGTVSFQQPAPGTGGTASPTAAVQAAGDNKESASKRKRGGPGGLNKVCAISPELQTIVGETVMSRTQIVKQLWQYIRQNNLQDPDDKRKIICNDELRVVFGTDTTDMFKMNKLLAKHITPLDPKDQIREAKKYKPSDVATQPMPPINQPSVVISDALAKFIGMEGTVPQDDALRYLWDYIKANQLEDVIAGSILCDSKLQELFGCESIPSSGLSELLAHHFIKET
uniref:SWIB/MDM2 domain-containing protein n=1 Tax=Oryza minuta TaxID=63629 RepID=G9C2Z7_ORYMI|nr:SWIB/MDM2 domain-containing protein [Oryza minuta]